MTRFAVVIDKPAGAETVLKAHGTALMINTALRAAGGKRNAAEHGENEVMHYVKRTKRQRSIVESVINHGERKWI